MELGRADAPVRDQKLVFLCGEAPSREVARAVALP